jgi:hypothetical protein
MLSRPARKPTRGKARNITQLSFLQNRILLWLLEQEEQIVKTKNKKELNSFYLKGIRWDSQKFFRSTLGKNFNKGTLQSNAAKLSRSRSKLEVRKLVDVLDGANHQGKKSRVSHARLTDLGKKVAKDFRQDPRDGTTKRKVLNLRKKVDGINRYTDNYKSEHGEDEWFYFQRLRWCCAVFQLQRLNENVPWQEVIVEMKTKELINIALEISEATDEEIAEWHKQVKSSLDRLPKQEVIDLLKGINK